MRQYEVIVDDTTMVYAGTDGLAALTRYLEYVRRSEQSSDRGPYAGTQVTVFRDDLIWYDHRPAVVTTATGLASYPITYY